MDKPHGIKAVLFDFDGTLVHLPIRYAVIRKRLAELFMSQGSFHPLMDGIRRSLRRLKESERRRMRKKAWEILDEEELRSASEAVVWAGVLDVLQCLKMDGLKLGIVSSNGSKVIRSVMRRMGFPNFDAVVGRDEVDKWKPDPEGVEKAVKKIRIPKRDVLFVGDRPSDREACARADVRFLLAGISADRLTAGAGTPRRLLKIVRQR